MEALFKEISKVLEAKDLDIYCLKSENKRLRAEIEELKVDIEKYKENKVNRI